MTIVTEKIGVCRSLRKTMALLLPVMFVFGAFPILSADINSKIGGDLPIQQDTNNPKTSGDIVKVAKDWLAATPANKHLYEPEIKAYTGNVDDVMRWVRPGNWTDMRVGEVFFQWFSAPGLKNKYSEQGFHIYVPTNYTPAKKMGLVIWMHGGGSPIPDLHDDMEWLANNSMHKFEGGKRCYLRPEVDESPFISVAPNACRAELIGYPDHASRWNVPACEEYLRDIISEMGYRYNIDYNRVILTGFSMGGIGCYHEMLRLNDRIAAAMPSAGSWTLGQWETMKYTPMYMIHGMNDSYWNSPSDYRWHGTDYAYPKLLHSIMTNLSYDHQLKTYFSTPGHGWDNDGEDYWAEFVNGYTGWVQDKYRDPYVKDVIGFTPRTNYESGSNGGWDFVENPSPRNWWVSIDEIRTGEVPVSYARTEGSGSYGSYAEWADYQMYEDIEYIRGGRVNASIKTGNTIDVTTTNVEKLSLWLSPKMLDFSKPITVNMNGGTATFTAKANLFDALRNYERTEDWDMDYQYELALNVTTFPAPIVEEGQIPLSLALVSVITFVVVLVNIARREELPK